jgi:hypothetical protein
MLHRFRFTGSNAHRGGQGNSATDRPSDPDLDEPISLAISVRGWCVTPGLLSPVQVAQLGHAVDGLRRRGFPHAGFGRGADIKIRPEVRAERPYLATLDGSR